MDPLILDDLVKNKHDFTVVWKDLSYEVDPRPWIRRIKDRCASGCNLGAGAIRKKIILDNICGDVRSGQLTGILGPSGAGKTSLLRCLFQNYDRGTTGHIMVEGGTERLKVCFIPQKDYLNEFLTVREDLTYVSKLRATKNVTDMRSIIKPDANLASFSADHDANAIQVADSLGLTSCLDVLVKNISGGQRKRMSIARELMSKPNVLILDEPTTGLDSVTCYKTMQLLQDLAHHSDDPIAVIVTIHQPPKNVFRLFDKTYFISNTGKVVYDDAPDNVVDTLQQVAATSLPTAHYNPASAMIEIASDKTREEVIDRLAVHQKLIFDSVYSPSRFSRLIDSKKANIVSFIRGKILPTSSRTTSNAKGDDLLEKMPHKKNLDYSISAKLKDCLFSHPISFKQSIRHTSILTHRFWRGIARNPSLMKARVMFHILAPILMLLVFGTETSKPNGCPRFNVSLDSHSSLDRGLIAQNIEETKLSHQNTMFFLILLSAFGISIMGLSTTHYPTTIHLFKKEIVNGLYSTRSYFFAQTIAEFPFEIGYPFLSVVISYAISGQIPSYLEWRMFAMATCVSLCCYAMHTIGLSFGAMFIENLNIAAAFGQVALWIPMWLSGVIIQLPRMPNWMQFLSRASLMKHALSSIMTARYGFNVCQCDESLLHRGHKVLGVQRLPDNVKHVLQYMFPKNETDNIDVVEMFDKLGDRLSEALSFGQVIETCEDVQPYLMMQYGFKDSDLYLGPMCMIVQIVLFKILTYYCIRSVPYRVK